MFHSQGFLGNGSPSPTALHARQPWLILYFYGYPLALFVLYIYPLCHQTYTWFYRSIYIQLLSRLQVATPDSKYGSPRLNPSL